MAELPDGGSLSERHMKAHLEFSKKRLKGLSDCENEDSLA